MTQEGSVAHGSRYARRVSTRHGAGPLREGDRLGKYEIVAYLASGGMAELYLARSRGIAGFEKVVALKRILPKLAEDEDVVSMFIDEARLAASLHHPNLAQVYDIGRDGGSFFFTMEYIHGEDLRSVMLRAAKKKRGLSLSTSLLIVTQVAAGLHHAHDKKAADGQPLGTVHRDVSPANVMLTMDGAVKIVDFGVAKAAARKTQTQTGSVKGKVGYLSPEQAQGEELDRRSDVFALGILLFELTTGTRLYKGPHDLAVLSKLLNQDAPLPSSRVPDYPSALEEIVFKALRRDPRERYDTAQELQVALEDFAREQKLALSSVALARFLREVIGEREDPTARRLGLSGIGAALPDDQGDGPDDAHNETSPGAKTATGTLSGSASRPAIPLERGRLRVLLLGAVVVVAGAWIGWTLAADQTPATDRPAASASSLATATKVVVATDGAPPTSTSQSPPDTVLPAESAASIQPTASASEPPPAAKPRGPQVNPPPTTTSSVPGIDGKEHVGDKPGWDPGSVLPPVVESN